MYIGEAISGDDADRAHVNVVLGPRGGPAGTAFATVLNSPSPRHTPFLVVARPGFAVRPLTLFVNRLPIDDETYGTLIWGPVQLATALAVTDLRDQGLLPAEAARDWVILVTASLSAGAGNADAVFANAYAATFHALEAALANEAPDPDLLRALLGNRFYAPTNDDITAARARLALLNG